MKNADIKPRDIFYYSVKKCWFVCKQCKIDFKSKPFLCTGWCRDCKALNNLSLGEALFKDFFEKTYKGLKLEL